MVSSFNIEEKEQKYVQDAFDNYNRRTYLLSFNRNIIVNVKKYSLTQENGN